jgi:hypothetical protein
MKLYISGAITGIPFEQAKANFNSAAVSLSITGLESVNPMDLNHDHDQSWESYMRVDLPELLKCDGIYMLRGWHQSKGANIEYSLASALGMKIIFQ